MPYHTNRVEDLLFKHKSVVKVDMADLDGEKENLANFLRSQFKLNSSITPEGLELNMEDVSTYALARGVRIGLLWKITWSKSTSSRTKRKLRKTSTQLPHQ